MRQEQARKEVMHTIAENVSQQRYPREKIRKKGIPSFASTPHFSMSSNHDYRRTQTPKPRRKILYHWRGDIARPGGPCQAKILIFSRKIMIFYAARQDRFCRLYGAGTPSRCPPGVAVWGRPDDAEARRMLILREIGAKWAAWCRIRKAVVWEATSRRCQ